MLKHRVITAVVLLSVFLTVLFVLPAMCWSIFLAMIVLAGFYEWLQIASVKSTSSKVLLCIILLVVMYCLYLHLIPLNIIVTGSILLWCMLIFSTLTYHSKANSSKSIIFSQAVKLVIAVYLLATTWWMLHELRLQSNGALWILFFLTIIWSADIGAYFSGKRFGKTKLAPNVSPGKTVEGVLGGLLAVALLSVMVSIKSLPTHVLAMLFICLLTAIISVGGDLYESQLKRQAGMKDSGNILPGHGGILDRIDSVLAGLPFFVAGLLVLKLLPDFA